MIQIMSYKNVNLMTTYFLKILGYFKKFTMENNSFETYINDKERNSNS